MSLAQSFWQPPPENPAFVRCPALRWLLALVIGLTSYIAPGTEAEAQEPVPNATSPAAPAIPPESRSQAPTANVAQPRLTTPFPLAELAPAETALFMSVHNLDAHWSAFEASSLGQHWQASRLARDVWQRTQPFQRWTRLDATVKALSGETLTRHLRTLFAAGVAVAVILPDHGEPQALLLGRSQSAEALQRGLKTWHQLEPGESQPQGPLSGPYFRRSFAGKDERALFYAVRGDVLVLSDRSALVAAAAGRLQRLADGATRQNDGGQPAKADGGTGPERHAPVIDTLATVNDYREFLGDAAADRVLEIYLAPRAWDPVLRKELHREQHRERLLAGWSALRAATVKLDRSENRLRWQFRLELHPDRLPASWTASLPASRSASTVPELEHRQDRSRQPQPHAHPSALAAQAWLLAEGHWSPQWLIEQVVGLLGESERRDWERATQVVRGYFGGPEPWTDVVGALFADWSLAVGPRLSVAATDGPSTLPESSQRTAAGGKSNPFFPWAMVARVRWSDNPTNTIAERFQHAAIFGLQALALQANTEPQQPAALVRSERHGTATRWWLSGRADRDWGLLIEPHALTIGTPPPSSRVDNDAATSEEPTAVRPESDPRWSKGSVADWDPFASVTTPPAFALAVNIPRLLADPWWSQQRWPGPTGQIVADLLPRFETAVFFLKATPTALDATGTLTVRPFASSSPTAAPATRK